jgi:AhpD family alkylhydroperoxidase
MSIKEIEPRIYDAMREAEKQIKSFGLDARLIGLIKVRASQLNGCGYCINMHSMEARKAGETEQRLYAVSAWWETPFFTAEEQAVLKLTEAVTNIGHGVPDDVYNNAARILGQQKLAQVIFVIIVINGWNRIAVATHMVAEQTWKV